MTQVNKLVLPIGDKQKVLTTLEWKTFKVEWIVKDFLNVNCTHKEVLSPEFLTEDKQYPIWIKCYNSGYLDSIKIDVYVKVWNKFNTNLPNIKFKVALINSFGNRLGENIGYYYSSSSLGCKCTSIELVGEKNTDLNNTLTVLCELFFEEGVVHEIGAIKKDAYAGQIENNLVKDFEKMLKNTNFSDITLVVGKKEFNLHRIILSSRSSVFAAMFSSNVVEKNSNKLEIPNMSEEIMEEVFRYIYTGKINKTAKVADELFKAADLYDLQDLKEMCLMVMLEKMCAENAADLLALAETYNLPHVTKQVREFITRNRQVFQTKSWENLLQANPSLVYKTLLP